VRGLKRRGGGPSRAGGAGGNFWEEEGKEMGDFCRLLFHLDREKRSRERRRGTKRIEKVGRWGGFGGGRAG